MSKIQKALDALRDSPKRDSKSGDRGANEIRGRKIASSHFEAPLDGRELVVAEDVKPATSLQVDLELLRKNGMLPDGKHTNLVSQQFRRIKRPVLQWAFDLSLPIGENSNVIMVASALPGAGKSFCSLSLANSVATERDFGAVLVDADVLKPGISTDFGMDDHIGLIDYLVDPAIQIEDILVQTDLNDIILIPAGRIHPEATELLASRRMREFVSTISRMFQHRAIVFDTPPLLITNEAQVLSEQMGQIVFVIEARVSSQESVLQALSVLDRDKPINAILNKSRGASASGYQSDDYGYYSHKKGSVIDAADD